MSELAKCAWCGSLETQQGFDQRQCLNCGLFTSADGQRTVATSQANEGVTVADITPPVPVTEPEPVAPPEPEPETAEDAETEAETVG